MRYTCLRDVRENLIVSVREFPTCNYVVLVSTPLLCQHATFKPPVRTWEVGRRTGVPWAGGWG